jgi:hypothetical protein
MTAPRPRRLLAVALLAATVAVVAACAPTTSTPPPATPGAQPTAPAEPEEPTSPGPEETVGAVDPEDVTCEMLLEPELVDDLTSRGWTPREDPFYIGDVELTDGTACTWGDFTAETGDNLLLFAWSPITTEERTTALAALQAEGWTTEEGADGLYVTEDPAEAIAVDDDGYGMTYLFGDGWVTLSDTKQGLVLIQRPAV